MTFFFARHMTLERCVTVVDVQFFAFGLSHCLSNYFAKRASLG